MGWKTNNCDLSSQSEHVCTSKKAMAQSAGTVGFHYGWRSKIHLTETGIGYRLRAVNGPPGMKRGGPLTGYATIRRARTDLPARRPVMNHSISPRCRCEKRCIGPSPLGALCQWNQTDPNGLSEPWRTSYGTHRLRRAVRTRCIHRSAW